jgi:hypothetical protein
VIGWSRIRAVAGGAADGRPTLSRFFPLERGFGPRLRGADMADLPGGASGLRVRGYMGKEWYAAGHWVRVSGGGISAAVIPIDAPS